ncbi:MAG: transketolase [Spirochaetales bacterium]|nr:transketolase [Spirochaetales bacterium]
MGAAAGARLGEAEVLELRRAALRVRRNILRLIAAGGAGHVGGALSAADLLTFLYFRQMRIDPARPDDPGRDRLVLSAGHKCLGLYAALAARGFFPEELLDTYGALGSRLPGHPDMHKLPGVEASTGALGHGLAIAGGMAMGLRLRGLQARVYVVMGDGEQAEGSNWEAAAAASHHGLDNLVSIVDRNRLQISGPTAEVMSYEPLEERWRAFGWAVRVVDGHDFQQIAEALHGLPFQPGKPSAIVADTIKSRGLPFAEGKVEYHHWSPKPDELDRARGELEAAGKELGA